MSEELYDLPDGWAWVVLKDIVSCLESGSRPRGGVKHIKEGVPSIGGEHLTYEGKFNFDKIRYVPIDFFEEMLKGRIEKRDILIVKDGATTGKISFVDESFPFREATINEHVFKLRTFDDYMIPQYLFYFLYSRIGNRQMLDCFQGSAQGGINQSFVNKVHIPVSPYNQQKHIVGKIENLFGRFNTTKQELAKIPPLIKKFRQSVLAKAFTGELTKEWRDQQENLEPASALLARIREERKKKLSKKYREPEPIDTSNLPELPEGWEPSSIEELSELVTKGSTPTSYGYEYQATGIAFVKVENISDGYIAYKTIKQFINRETHDFLKRSQLKENDILFSIAGTIGRACIIRSGDLPANTNQALAIIRVPSPFIDKRFLLKYLTSHSAQLVARSGVRGVGMSNIGLRNVRNLIVPIPPYLEQLEIMKGIERLSTRVDLVEKAVQIAQAHCQKLAQSILAKAFRGELVEQDPDDEPASMLLEKIKSEKGRMSLHKIR